MATTGGGRPTGYKLADGTRVPSVTTIVGRFKDSGGLIRWAYNCGRDGIDMDKAKDDAATAGKIAHSWIDDEVHGRQTPIGDEPGHLRDLATGALFAFRTWREQVRLEIVDTERPLVSEAHRFGGTYDAIGMVHGALALVDWKTSNKIYPEYVIQLGGYAGLYEECMGKQLNGAHLLRVGKEYGDFHYHHFPAAVIQQGWEAFRLLRRLYDIDSVLKKVAA